MATLEITHPAHTKTLTLATTVGRIEVSPAAAGRTQALYLYCTTEVRYQITTSALADGSTAPTTNYGIVPASTLVPIPVELANRADAQNTPWAFTVWVASGTPTLHVAPYPVTR